MRTRIKFCGFTREQDILDAVALGVDAIGFVCYNQSKRFVPPERLAQLSGLLPAFVTPVLLFVNASCQQVQEALACVPNALLQFHGHEKAADCAQFSRPWIKAVPIRKPGDFEVAQSTYSGAAALLVDAPTELFGGSGETFDWNLLPEARHLPLILAGGLTPKNLGKAVTLIRPYALDASSSLEVAPGVKDMAKMKAFIEAVRLAEAD